MRASAAAVAVAAAVATVASVSAAAVASSEHELHAGVWTWNCDGAGYQGAHPPGYYTSVCEHEVFDSPPPTMLGALQVYSWSVIEPQNGVYNWTAFDANLTAMAAHGVQAQPMIFIHKDNEINGVLPTPTWLFDAVPPVVYRKSPTGRDMLAPDYLNPAFQKIFERLIDAFAAHIAALPAPLKASVWSVQSAFGITGDSRPWDGTPVNASKEISGLQWVNYCRKMSQKFLDAFTPTGVPVLANLANPAYNQSDDGWWLDAAAAVGMQGAAIKEGIVSHGYALNGERDLYTVFAVPYLLTPQPDGSYARARGELALEPDPDKGTYGNWAVSPAWSLQANAEWVLTFGLDVWNLYAGFLSNATFDDTLQFVNRHAGHKDAATSPAAFIGFRDSLNTEDVDRWPVARYGPVNSTDKPGRCDTKRMQAIVADFAAFGARVDDVEEAASHRSIRQKKGMYLNDVCWRCWPSNYGRYIEQVDPLGTSVGWWRLGPKDQAHGRFARGLHHASNKTRMTLRMHADFSVANATASVVYFDEGAGSWSLAYDGATKATVIKRDSGRWQKANFSLGRVAGGSTIELWSPDASDVAFSLLEVLSKG